MLGAELTVAGALEAEGRVLYAAGVGAFLADDVDHARGSMLAAVLRLYGRDGKQGVVVC